jgi:hypothetical protein
MYAVILYCVLRPQVLPRAPLCGVHACALVSTISQTILSVVFNCQCNTVLAAGSCVLDWLAGCGGCPEVGQTR